ncbi:40S ribosomal protein eS8 [Magnusiomyces paraingens]|uniref:40S ribosomal protein S8 n=1 Tax=Magnusiomyces paraingens TaxID=2606893 RepID=A0A5E8BNE2_9ASCO|nr:uncharacterized protein SAPINGB_P002962 [Saprochaete ingens]VVT51035.1 unnamed protein product [Saprochaete ingens]
MSISRDSRHKRSHTGAKRAQIRKKRKFELGRQPSNTKIGAKRVHPVRVRGGNLKYRALRLESGNYSWGSEGVTRKTRVIKVVYHPSNNELVRTNTLTRAAIVQIDATPFRQWYENHYALPLGKKKGAAAAAPVELSKPEGVSEEELAERQKTSKVESALETQFAAGRVYAAISSRPGQSGRADGYILEGEELAFYLKKLVAKK